MSLEMMLGSKDHISALESTKNDLFAFAYKQQGLSFMRAQEIYVTAKHEALKKTIKDKLPDWYMESKAVQTLERYVFEGYHNKRYENVNKKTKR